MELKELAGIGSHTTPTSGRVRGLPLSQVTKLHTKMGTVEGGSGNALDEGAEALDLVIEQRGEINNPW